MEQVAYIDGDVLPYKVGFATQRTMYRGEMEGQHTCPSVFYLRSKAKVNKWVKRHPDLLVSEEFLVEDEHQAITTLQLNLNNIVQGCGNIKFKVVLSGETNFRDEVATIQPYKGNREGSEKPKHWAMLREWLAAKPYTIITDNEEADDVISRACMEGHICATIDKDLMNTPGDHYNWNKKEGERRFNVTPEQATFNFYAQCLTGDDADHIPGIKGVGPARAKKILADCTEVSEYEAAVLAAYDGIYPDPVTALTEIGQLLWMRRYENEMYRPVTAGGMYTRGS